MKRRPGSASFRRFLLAGLCLAASPVACGSSGEKRRAPPGVEAGSAGALNSGASGAGGGGIGAAAAGGELSTAAGGAEPLGGATNGGAGEGGAGEGGSTIDSSGGEGGTSSGGDAGNTGQGGEGSFEGDCEDVSLLVNCGFEQPVAGTGSFQLFAKGQDLGGWLVIGATGNVNTIDTAFTEGGFSWPAQQGAQTLDLTGISNTATGVSQAVVTEPGEEYELSFWFGNVDPGGAYGSQSSVSVSIDGSEILKPTNAEGADTSTLAWRQFATTFTAAGASTTVAFVNADPSDDYSNIIDNVVLLQR